MKRQLGLKTTNQLMNEQRTRHRKAKQSETKQGRTGTTTPTHTGIMKQETTASTFRRHNNQEQHKQETKRSRTATPYQRLHQTRSRNATHKNETNWNTTQQTQQLTPKQSQKD